MSCTSAKAGRWRLPRPRSGSCSVMSSRPWRHKPPKGWFSAVVAGALACGSHCSMVVRGRVSRGVRRHCSIICNTSCSTPCHRSWLRSGRCWFICHASTPACASIFSVRVRARSGCTRCRKWAASLNPGKTPSSGCGSSSHWPGRCVKSRPRPGDPGIAARANGSAPKKTGRAPSSRRCWRKSTRSRSACCNTSVLSICSSVRTSAGYSNCTSSWVNS
ncbi:hypothetical protein D3C85_1038090 [compost metagenome]